MNWLEKRAIRDSHPVAFTLDIVGITLGIFGLWNHDVAYILTGLIILPLIGHIYAYLGQNKIRSLMLNHLHPVNIATHISGFFIGVYGLWQHNYSLIIISIALMIIGHIYTWR